MRTVVALGLASLVACGEAEPVLRGDSGLGRAGVLAFALEWTGSPTPGRNPLVVEVTTAAGAPVEGATLTVDPFMPAHGHGSTATPVVTPLGDGRYRVDELVLTMAGEWHLTLHARAETLDDEAIFAVDVR